MSEKMKIESGKLYSNCVADTAFRLGQLLLKEKPHR